MISYGSRVFLSVNEQIDRSIRLNASFQTPFNYATVFLGEIHKKRETHTNILNYREKWIASVMIQQRPVQL